MTRKRGEKFNGYICARHPEDLGLRYASNRTCVACASMWKANRNKPQDPSRGEKVNGEPCARHPELAGLRYGSNGICISCSSIWTAIYRKMPGITKIDLAVQREDLLAALTSLMDGATERDPKKWHEARRQARELIARVNGGQQ